MNLRIAVTIEIRCTQHEVPVEIRLPTEMVDVIRIQLTRAETTLQHATVAIRQVQETIPTHLVDQVAQVLETAAIHEAILLLEARIRLVAVADEWAAEAEAEVVVAVAVADVVNPQSIILS
jgi:hypothetical protein